MRGKGNQAPFSHRRRRPAMVSVVHSQQRESLLDMGGREKRESQSRRPPLLPLCVDTTDKGNESSFPSLLFLLYPNNGGKTKWVRGGGGKASEQTASHLRDKKNIETSCVTQIFPVLLGSSSFFGPVLGGDFIASFLGDRPFPWILFSPSSSWKGIHQERGERKKGGKRGRRLSPCRISRAKGGVGGEGKKVGKGRES